MLWSAPAQQYCNPMAIKAERSFSLADQLFNDKTLSILSEALAAAWPAFDKAKFTTASLKAFPDLELKARIRFMVDQLDEQLPEAFEDAVDILERALPAPLDPTLTDDDFGQFIWSVPADWVALRGCTEARLARSLNFLRQATMRFSVESAIRPFLAEFPEQTMQFIERCAT